MAEKGKLSDITEAGEVVNGRYRITYNCVHCDDCDVDFFVNVLGEIMCNGYKITKCPWCRVDSKPFKNGRSA